MELNSIKKNPPDLLHIKTTLVCLKIIPHFFRLETFQTAFNGSLWQQRSTWTITIYILFTAL